MLIRKQSQNGKRKMESNEKQSLPGYDRVARDATSDPAPPSFANLGQRGSRMSSRINFALLGGLQAGGGPASLTWLGSRDLADSAHGERGNVIYLASCISK